MTGATSVPVNITASEQTVGDFALKGIFQAKELTETGLYEQQGGEFVHTNSLSIDPFHAYLKNNEGSQRTYYQSAYTLYDNEQVDREKRPMLQIHDSSRKVLLTSDVDMPWNDEDGILHLGLLNFLLEQ